jgi:hypothetical protein
MMKKLSEWLAATTPIKCVEDCSICRKIPAYCSRLEKGGELVGDDIPGTSTASRASSTRSRAGAAT